MKRGTGQRGQAMLVVLVFLAAFLILTWAALRLASEAFINASSVQADTRSTYALDAGVGYVIGYVRNRPGPLCPPPAPPPLQLVYPTITHRVTVSALVAGGGCTNAAPVLDFTVTDSATSRRLLAEVKRTGGIWAIVWEAYQ